MKQLFLAIILLASSFCYAEVKVLPLSNELRGSADFSWFVFEVYKAKLLAPKDNTLYTVPLSLELIYKRGFKGADISARSFSELQGQGHQKAYIEKWKKHVLQIFPDIKKGDSILANYSPKYGVKFYLNRKQFLGVIEDKQFATAFMDIWLGEKTSEPDLRRSLLGDNS